MTTFTLNGNTHTIKATDKLARRYADKKDLAYGAICTNIRLV